MKLGGGFDVFGLVLQCIFVTLLYKGFVNCLRCNIVCIIIVVAIKLFCLIFYAQNLIKTRQSALFETARLGDI